MIHFVLIIGLFVLVVAVTMLGAGSDGAQRDVDRRTRPDRRLRLRRRASDAGREGAGAGLRARLDDLSTSIGRWLAQRFSRLRGKDYRSRLIAAGMYTTTPERLLGTQFLVGARGTFLWIWLSILADVSILLLVVGTIGVAALPAGCSRCSSSTPGRRSGATWSSEAFPT